MLDNTQAHPPSRVGFALGVAIGTVVLLLPVVGSAKKMPARVDFADSGGYDVPLAVVRAVGFPRPVFPPVGRGRGDWPSRETVVTMFATNPVRRVAPPSQIRTMPLILVPADAAARGDEGPSIVVRPSVAGRLPARIQ
ncbi:MAG: hypothetical protein U0804_24365 [Gemmataceae bacterium]